MSPGLEPAEQPAKRRPTPLLLEALLNYFDSEDEYDEAHRPQPQVEPSTEVPVRRTFIEYGSPTSRHDPRQAVSTAPACMGFSMGWESSWEDGTSPSTFSPSDAGRSRSETDWPVQGPAVAGIGCLPTVLYYLSPASAKAAGYGTWGVGSAQSTARGATMSSRTPDEAEAEAEVEAEADAEAEAEAGSSASTAAGGDSDDEDRNFCVEYSPDAKPPSVGSALHGEGGCKRCCFFPKGRCNNGESCQFCHFAHEKRKPKNKKKTKKRRRARRATAATPPTPTTPTTPTTTPTTPMLPLQSMLVEVCGEPCVCVPAIIPSQVVVDASFPQATAMAFVPVPYAY